MMMKKLYSPFLLKTVFFVLLMLTSVKGWGQTITITVASAGGSANLGNNAYGGSGTSDRPERTWTQSTVGFAGKAITANATNSPTNPTTAATLIQAQASNGVIYNTTPIPGRITSVQVITAGTAAASTIYGGSSRLVTSTAGDFAVTGTQFGTGSGNQTWSTGTADYTYFAIKRGSVAAYFSSIIITYEVVTTPCASPINGGTASVLPISGSPGTDYVVSATGYSTGTGLTYQWQYNINNAGWSNSSPVNIPSSTTYANYSATNDVFAPDVGQSVQWRLISTCSNGGNGTSSGAIFSSVVSYCTPVFTENTDYIVNFGLESIINNASGFSPGGYGNFTALSTNLTENSSYNATLRSSAGTGNHGAAIWIDLNNNGTFETGERVGSLPNNVVANSNVTIPITIPSGNIGSHRMRVMYQYNVAGTAINPCVSSDYGEAEDYTVNITAATPTVTVTSAVTGLAYNFGSGPSNAQTFTVAGTNLSNNITVDAPANFEIATSLGGTYSSSLTVNHSGGTVATTTLYVRLIAGLAVNTYTGNIEVKSSPATTQTISLSGTVSPVVNYDLAYNGNGNDIGTAPTTQTGATTYTVEGNPGNLTRIGGFYFMGWTLNADGSGTPYGPGDPSFTPTIGPLTANTTLYARYVYTIVYLGNGSDGGTAPTQQTNYNSLPTVVSGAGTLVRAGYTFTGWNTAADGSGTAYAPGANFVPAVHSGITQLHAQWLLNVPVISTSGTLTARTTTYGAPSTNATFTVSANYLTNPLIITAPAGFEVSLAAGTGFATSLDLGTGTRTNTTIYVRLAATTPVGTAHNGNVAVTSTGATSVNVSIPNSTVSAKGLTITGLTGNSKVYDGNTTATVTGGAYAGLVNGETFANLVGTVSWAYPDANFAASKVLVRTGSYDPPTTNYTVTQPTGITGGISKKPLSVAAPSIASKVYDGNAATGIVTPGTITGFVGTETVTANAIGTFDAPNAADAGTNKPATIIYTLVNGTNGGLAINYSLANGPGVGAITRAPAVISPNSISVIIGAPYELPGGISSTSDGAITYTMTNNAYATLTGSTINGLVVGTNTLTVTQAQGTNHLAGSATVLVDVTDIANDTYRTVANGDWNTLGIWEVKTTSGWVPASSVPIAANASDVFSNAILVNNTITLSLANIRNFKAITVNSGGSLAKSGTQPLIIALTDGKLLIKDGGRMSATTLIRFSSNATFEIEDGGTYIHNQGSSAQLPVNIFSGKEKFHPNSNFVINTVPEVVGTTSTTIRGLISDFSALTPFDTGNFNSGYFGNIIFETAAVSVSLVVGEGTTQTIAGATDYNIAAGNIIYRSGTSTSRLININNSQTSTTVSSLARPYKIGGSIILESGYTGNVRLRDTPVNTHFKIGKNIELASGTSFSILAGAITNSTNLYIDGDISVNASATFTNATTANNNANVYLTGNPVTTGPDYLHALTIAPLTGSNSKINYIVNSKSYAALGSHLALGTNSNFSVLSGGTLDFGFAGSTALNITGNGITGTGFSAAAGSYLKITSPAGISNTSGTSGNIQTNTAPVFTQPLTYHYNGNENQMMGTGVGSASNGKAIIVDLANKDLTLTPSTAFGITSNANANVNGGNGGILDIRTGRLVETDALYITGGSTAADGGTLKMVPNTYYKITRTSGTGESEYIPRFYNTIITGGEIELASTGNQTLRGGKTYYDLTFSNGAIKEVSDGTADINGLISIMANTTLDGKSFTVGKTVTELLMDSGSLFKTGGNGAKPDAGGDYVLDENSTIEFQGTSATKIKVTPEYENVNISGTNVEVGGKNFVVNQILKVINPEIVTESSLLTIPDVADNVAPYVVNAKKGIQVASRGKIIFKNNAQLMQNETASNLGSVQVDRNVNSLNNNLETGMDYVYWSSPVKGNGTTTGQSIRNGFSPETPATEFKQYKESDNRFVSTPDVTFKSGKGYAIRAENVTPSTPNPYSKTYIFTGEPNNGVFNGETLLKSATGNGYNLVGNPYPSNLDLDKLFTLNSAEIYSVAYMWTNVGYEKYQAGSGYKGNNYAIYNRAGGNPATTYTLGFDTTDKMIKVGQGFILQAKADAVPLKFNHTVRATDHGSWYEKNNEEKNRYWLQHISPENVVNTILVGYFDNATNDFDPDYDARLFGSPSDVIYSLLGTQKLLIQGKSIFNVEDKVSLGNSQSVAGNYTIKLAGKEGIFATGQPIYLHDKSNNTYTNLQDSDFVYPAQVGSSTNRFEIVYKSATLAAENNVKESLIIYRDSQRFIVKSGHHKIDKVDVYDAAGRLLKSINTGAVEVNVDASTLSSGVYFLNIYRNNQIINKKIIK